jgi:hypothetical protein
MHASYGLLVIHRILEKVKESTRRREELTWTQRLINKDSDVDEIKQLRQQLDDAMARFGVRNRFFESLPLNL